MGIIARESAHEAVVMLILIGVDLMNVMKRFWSSVFSFFAVIGYFSPWMYGATHSNLGFYLLSFFWFLFAWILLIFHLVKFIIRLRKNDSEWKINITNFLAITLCYVSVFIGIANDYMVTV